VARLRRGARDMTLCAPKLGTAKSVAKSAVKTLQENLLIETKIKHKS